MRSVETMKTSFFHWWVGGEFRIKDNQASIGVVVDVKVEAELGNDNFRNINMIAVTLAITILHANT